MGMDRRLMDRRLMDRSLMDRRLMDRRLMDRRLIDRRLMDRRLMDRRLMDRRLMDSHKTPHFSALMPSWCTFASVERHLGSFFRQAPWDSFQAHIFQFYITHDNSWYL